MYTQVHTPSIWTDVGVTCKHYCILQKWLQHMKPWVQYVGCDINVLWTLRNNGIHISFHGWGDPQHPLKTQLKGHRSTSQQEGREIPAVCCPGSLAELTGFTFSERAYLNKVRWKATEKDSECQCLIHTHKHTHILLPSPPHIQTQTHILPAPHMYAYRNIQHTCTHIPHTQTYTYHMYQTHTPQRQ